MLKRHPNLTLLLTLAALLLTPAPSHAATASTDERYFPETNHSVVGKFLHYWQDNGGLARFGYPISEEMDEVSALDGKSYGVQYFERAEFEHHPENQPPYDVELTQLGTMRYNQQYPTGAPNQQANPNNPYTFAETGKTIGGAFRAYWEQHGGLTSFGYPISNEFQEVSTLNGKPYTVQYFERAEFELHPENAALYNVLLSQLGTYRYDMYYVTTAPRLTTHNLHALNMVSKNEGWAVGDSGLIMHYNNGNWVSVSSPTDESLWGVSMVSPTDGWAVGIYGAILHYNGTSWIIYGSTGIQLYSIDMLSADEGWATGYQGADGASLHYYAGKWTQQGTSAENLLTGLSMVSPERGWAVGPFDIVRYDGSGHGAGEWIKESKPDNVRLQAVKMLPSGEGWAVGSGILHYSNGAWLPVGQPGNSYLTSISLNDANNGWAVGTGGTILQLKEGRWSEYASPASNSLLAVYTVGTDEAWAVGDSGTILHYQSSIWSEVSPVPSHLAYGVKINDNLTGLYVYPEGEGWIVSSRGSILHHSGDTWNRVISPVGAQIGVHLSAVRDMIVGDDGSGHGIILQYAGSYWQQADKDKWPPLYGIDNYYDYWAVGTQLDGSGFVIHYHEGKWSYDTTPPVQELYAIKMNSASDGWAVGREILHYNGNAWELEDNPSDVTLRNVDGNWIVGDIGTILHLSGGKWMAYSSPVTTNLRSIQMLPSDEGWAVGDAGTILHFSNGAWLRYPSPTVTNLNAIRMISSNEGWAVGEAGTILHYQNGTWSTYQ